MFRAFRLAVCTFCVFSAVRAAPVHAEQQPRAARLVSFEGTVQVLGAEEAKDQAGDVQVNMPLLEGMQLRTAEDGRAEIEFEDASIVRVTPNSQVSLESLGEKETAIGVVQGLAYFELRGESARPYSVRYGSNVAKLVTDSTFRVSLDVSPCELSVFGGEVVVANGDQKIIVRANEAVRFDAEGSERYFFSSNISPDSWDQWNDEQDTQAAAALTEQSDVAEKQTGSGSYGWSDLDAYGDWYPTQDAGVVWQPADAGADFDPYAIGAWGWYPGFGYTWISGYPWGWTPFHCGGWNYFDGFGWGWSPGACYGWGTGLHYRRPPPGFRPPLKPVGPPTVIRLRHPIIPLAPARPGVPVRSPVLPVHKTGSVMLDGAVVMPLLRKPTVIPGVGVAGEGADAAILGMRGGITRGSYPTSRPIRSTTSPVSVAPVMVNSLPRMNPPVNVRPMPLPSPARAAPSPGPPAPHVAAPAASASAPSHK